MLFSLPWRQLTGLPINNRHICLLQEYYESTYDNAAPLLGTLHQLMMQRLVPHLRSASMLQPGLLTCALCYLCGCCS